jgi:hypothetical protein
MLSGSGVLLAREPECVGAQEGAERHENDTDELLVVEEEAWDGAAGLRYAEAAWRPDAGGAGHQNDEAEYGEDRRRR